jgi:sphinganine-1-phosphate aldolase
MNWKEGAMSGTVYNCSKDGLKLIADVYGLTSLTNPLHPDAFPGIRQMEMEVVRMTCAMFNGDSKTVGCVATGGTESIILACKAYRDMAIERGVKYPEILCPVSAHAAFDKAADMLGVSIRHVPLDQDTMRVNVSAMRRMISGNTMMLVGSAPQFPHGSVDPIQEIAELGLRYNIPVHVDACLGGFLVPFMKSAGFQVPAFDFSVAGVTSISADTHKYGYAPKGTSVLMYRNAELRSYQWFSFPDWPGGIYATPTIGGSRSGGIIAACWATMVSYGKQGYIQATREIVSTTRKIAEEIATVPSLKIVGRPDVSVVAFASEKFNIYSLSDALKERGWALNALQFPECVHLCVTRLHTQPGVAEKFVRDVREATEIILKDPEAAGGGSAAVYGMAASIPDRSIVSELTAVYLDSLYASKRDIV